MKKVFIVIALLLIAIVVIGLLLPKGYDVNRNIKIKASPAEIHSILGDLKNWKDNWGSWQGGDSSVVNTLGDITTGVGAYQSWKSKNGGGKVIFTKSDLTGIEYDIKFDRDSIICKSYIKYQESKDYTLVTWGISGDTPNPVLGGYLTLMMDPLISGTIESDLYFLNKAVMKNKN
ncbi:MAG: hypothetical protein COA79_10185 [Planctomycetota bacterium]|nr:MAG: hypothetical protein COA79_10185 [Planctomycetota bacterium]